MDYGRQKSTKKKSLNRVCNEEVQIIVHTAMILQNDGEGINDFTDDLQELL